MTKTKDGFYKQIAGVTGDNSYVLLGGGGHFPIHSGRNNEANKIVRTDVSGYIQAGWINTTSGNMSTNFNKVYVSNDSYIRYKTKADFGAEMRDSGDMDGRWVLKDGDTMTGRLVNKLPSTRVITGNGVVGGDHGASANPRYFPSKWSFSTELSAVDGDVIIIKIPVAGHDYGVYVSIDDGANYYPVVLSGTGRLTTHYPANTCIELVFEANGSAASMFPLAGGNSRVTISNGVWRVINYYVDGNPGEWNLRQYTIKAAAAITGVHVIGGTDDGYKNVDSANMTFDIRYPVLYAGSAITSGSTGTNNFIHHYSVNIKNSSNSNVSFTSYKNIYIKGTISGTTFTPISGGNPYVQDITATDDGYVYYYIGRSYNGSAITFDGTGKDIYIYKNGAIRRWSGYSINTDNIKTVSTDRDTKHYLTFVDSDNSTPKYEQTYTNNGIFYNPGYKSFGHGYNVTASGNYSHAEGCDLPSSTIASNKVSFVVKVLSSSEKAIVKSATGFEFDYLYVHDHPSYFFSTVNWSGAIYGDSNLSNLCGYVVYVKNYEVNSSLHGTFFMLHVNIANKFPDPITLINGNTYYWAPIMGALGNQAHKEGRYNLSLLTNTHSEGECTMALGSNSHAEGSCTHANGLWSHAEGVYTTTFNSGSHAEGRYTIAKGNNSHAEGTLTQSNGDISHAEGYSNTASGVGAHAEGGYTTASGTYAHSEGVSTTASGEGAHAEGTSTTASGNYSHSSGSGTSASHNYETAIGKYNVSNSDTIFSVGIGTGTSDKKNGLEITTDGKVKAYDGFYKNNSNNTYVLLGGGDHKLESNLSVASAGKWTTARSLTIGSKSQSVDGSGNVTWTLAQIGAASSSHTHNGGVAKTAWGQQYVNASGILTSISGNMSSVGNIIPSGNNAQNIGSATNRWAKLYIGTADSYGSATQGIYWNAGVPTAMTYSLNATVNSSGNNNAGTVAYYSGTNTISSATKLFYDGSLWIGETSDAAERDAGVRSVAGTLYMFAQNSSTGYRGLYANNNRGSETFVILIDKDNNITFNGNLSGTASNADTVDGYHAYTSNEWNALKTLGNDGVIELGRYIDMHFIANDTNDYSTRIQLASNPNPANVLSLPTETGTLVTDVHPYGYVMKEYWVDYSTYNVNTYYPVIFDLSNHKKDNVRIEVIVALDSETKPAWSSHKTGGFSCCAIWEVNGSGWGTSVIRRTIYAWDWNCCDGTNGQCPMANIGQLSNSSEEYILLRGGGKYRIRTSHGVIPVAKYAKYDGWDEQFISPISYNTSSNSWPDTLNVSGYSTNPNNIDIGTKDNFGTTYGIFKYLGFSSTTLTVEIGGVKRTCTINPGIYVYNNYSSVTTIYPIGINSTGYGRWTTFYKRSEFYFTSEGAYHTSDIRKKYDIYDILNNDVNQLFETENGFIRHFKWKETSSDAYGFIAQELQEYCPEAVDLNEDNGYYSVNYNVAFSKIIGAMFKKIKELERKLQEKENH